MRRTEQEFKAEVFRRSSAFRKRKAENTKKFLTIIGCFALMAFIYPFLPLEFAAKSTDASYGVMDSMNMQAPQSAEAIPEQPEEAKAESIAQATGTEKTTEIILSPEDYEVMDAVSNCLNWTEGKCNCLMEIHIIRGEASYGFCMESGVLYDEAAQLTGVLSEEKRDKLIKLIEKYQ